MQSAMPRPGRASAIAAHFISEIAAAESGAPSRDVTAGRACTSLNRVKKASISKSSQGSALLEAADTLGAGTMRPVFLSLAKVSWADEGGNVVVLHPRVHTDLWSAMRLGSVSGKVNPLTTRPVLMANNRSGYDVASVSKAFRSFVKRSAIFGSVSLTIDLASVLLVFFFDIGAMARPKATAAL